MSESIEFKTRGVGTDGEILLGSNQVKEVIQSLITAFDNELNEKDKRIAELEKQNAELQKQCDGMSIDFECLLDATKNCCDAKTKTEARVILNNFIEETTYESNIQAHNLEQKIKALNDLFSYKNANYPDLGDFVSCDSINDELKDLRNQAKALKDGEL